MLFVLLCSITMMSIPAIVILVMLHANKYTNNVIENGEKHRFEYIDTFFYRYFIKRGDSEYDNTITMIYHAVSDLDTKEVYIVPETSFKNFRTAFVMDKVTVKHIKGMKSKNAEYGDQGTLFIDKKENDYFINDNGDITFGKTKLKYEKKDRKKIIEFKNKEPYSLFNLNDKYDVSLLDKAIFAKGVAIFDDII